jgi:uncharacterized membrane protein YfcA
LFLVVRAMIVEGITWSMLASAAAAFVLGGAVKGLAGFGLPLVVISLTSTFMPIEAALAINVIPPFLLNLWQIGGIDGATDTWRRYAPVLIGLPIGIAVGAASAATLDANWLVGAVGAVTVIFCIGQFAGWQLQMAPGHIGPAGLGTGLLSGFLGSLTSVTGPPLVMYLLAAKAPPDAFKSALGLFFLAAGIMLTIAYASIAFMTLPLALIGALMALPAAAGLWLGRRLSRRVDAKGFRIIVLALLGILGTNLIRRAMFG